jgi:hypothetical protein
VRLLAGEIPAIEFNMKIRREERSKCTCGRPAMVLAGRLEDGALFVDFVVGICLKSGAPISECRLAPPTASELEELKRALQQQPF